MKQKSWRKRYVFHAVVCVIVIGIAFWVNKGINLKKSRIYAVDTGNQTILRELTGVRTEEDTLVFSGWGFDTNYYNESSTYELILQDTETGEALWLKMKKNPEPMEITDHYIDTGNYSKAAFEGSIETERLKEDKVYEVLLRYASKFIDGEGRKQKYIKTVTTNKFFYQRELKEYNPKTFPLEIAESGLEKELQEAKLFYYFPEGLWIYYTEENLYYIVDKAILEDGKGTSFPVLWSEKEVEGLSDGNEEYAHGNDAFYIWENELIFSDIVNYRVWSIPKPSKRIVNITTGLYNDAEKYWILEAKKQIGDVFDEQ